MTNPHPPLVLCPWCHQSVQATLTDPDSQGDRSYRLRVHGYPGTDLGCPGSDQEVGSAGPKNRWLAPWM
jgi:hypothetical protein